MVRRHGLFALFFATTVVGSVAAASAASETLSRSVPKRAAVTDHVPQLDGPLKTVTGPDGRTWATWAYRAAGEIDIAVSSRDANASTWSAPVFFGRRNGADELDPAIAVDSAGAVYIAFTTTNPPRVAVAVLPAGSLTWSEPSVVSGTEAATSPALLVVASRLVVAYRTARGVAVSDMPIVGSGNHTEGIQDGPDGIDPINSRDKKTHSDTTPTVGETPNP